MDERRNNLAVEKRLKDKLKTDRARIQVGRISVFGLLEMSRQRLRPGMLEATTQSCSHCHGTGLIRSDDSLGLSILRQLEEEGTRGRAKEVLLTAPVGIVNFLINHKRDYIEAIEGRTGLSIRIEADIHMVSPDYKIERFKTPTRRITAVAPITSMDASLMEEVEEDAFEEAEAEEAAEVPETADRPDTEDQPKKKRRRRRGGRGRRKGGVGDDGQDVSEDGDSDSESDATPETVSTEETEAAGEPVDASAGSAEDDQPKRKRRGRRGGRGRKSDQPETDTGDETVDATADTPRGDEGVTPTDTDASPAETRPAEATPEAAEVTEHSVAEPAPEASPEPEPEPEAEAASAIEQEPETEPEPQPEPEPAPTPTPEPASAREPEPAREPATTADAPEDKPKRRGWWSIG
jgi:ribonuclease E